MYSQKSYDEIKTALDSKFENKGSDDFRTYYKDLATNTKFTLLNNRSEIEI